MYQPNITLTNIYYYTKGLVSFLWRGRPTLQASTFKRILAEVRPNTSGLPSLKDFKAHDGLVLRYRHYTCASDKILVLVHGSACFADMLAKMASAISTAGSAQVYTLDMRGHGNSEGERGHAVKYAAQMVDDLREFLTKIRNENGNARIFLGGHSAGGGLALGFSKTFEASVLVDGYVFLAPYVGMPALSLRPYFGGWLKRYFLPTTLALCSINVLGLRFLNNRSIVEFDLTFLSGDPRYVRTWSLNTSLAMSAGVWSPRDKMPPNKPVLLVFGEKDECYYSERYIDEFGAIAPHCKLVSAGPIGHFDLLVDDGAVASVRGWIARN